MGPTASGETVRPVDSAKPQQTGSAGDTRAAMPCVLVVDDDKDTREVLRMALEDEGYEVIEAANGSEALSFLWLCSSPLVVILDQRMPGLLGTEVLDRVLQVASPSHTRSYILLTASPHRVPPPYSHHRFQHFIPVMGKPMGLDDLLEAVKRACARLAPTRAIEGNA